MCILLSNLKLQNKIKTKMSLLFLISSLVKTIRCVFAANEKTFKKWMCQRNFKTVTINKIIQWAYRQTLADRQTRKHRSNIEEATAQPATLRCRALAEWLTKFLFIKGDRSLINCFRSLLQHVSHQFSLITSVSATASHSHLSPGSARSPSVFSCSQCQMLRFTSSSITESGICIVLR